MPDVDRVSFSFADAPEAFLRIIPIQPRNRPIPLASLLEVASRAEMLRSPGFGGSTFVNKYGAILYELNGQYRGGPAPLHRATQLFQNGELWSVCDSIMIRKHDGHPASLPMPLIPTLPFERAFYWALHKNIAFAVEYLGLSFPCTLELGLVGLTDAYLGFNQDNIWGPIQPNNAILRTELSTATPTAMNDALLEFFSEVYDKTGYARPSGLHGFPPGPPQRKA